MTARRSRDCTRGLWVRTRASVKWTTPRPAALQVVAIGYSARIAMSEQPLRIGEIARRTGVSVDTVRHYERLGLLGKAPRSSGGYRLFPPVAIDRVTLIRDAVRVGFSLRQLSTFLRARQDGRAPCRQVRAAGARILDELDQQIATLTSTRLAIQTMLDDWDERLARTPASEPARLLDAMSSGAARFPYQSRSNLKRPR